MSIDRRPGVDFYGSPDLKMGSYTFSAPRTESVRVSITEDRKTNDLRELPVGHKRFVPSDFQGTDGYGSPDPKFGTYSFDARMR